MTLRCGGQGGEGAGEEWDKGDGPFVPLFVMGS